CARGRYYYAMDYW
nr:immunoglobulin heavy chain junction region [Mus musculus]